MKIFMHVCFLGCLVSSALSLTATSGTRPLCPSEPADNATPSISPLPPQAPATPSPMPVTLTPTSTPSSTPTPLPSTLAPLPTPTPPSAAPVTTAPASATPTATATTPTPTTAAPGPTYTVGLQSGETHTSVEMLKNVCYSLSQCADVDTVNWGYYPGGNGIIVMMYTDDSCSRFIVSHPSERGGGYQKFSDTVRVKSIGLVSDFDDAYERVDQVKCLAPVPPVTLPDRM